MEEEIGEEECRKFQCGPCFSIFYMPNGIEPEFCPSCGKRFDEVKELVDTGVIGNYEPGEDAGGDAEA